MPILSPLFSWMVMALLSWMSDWRSTTHSPLNSSKEQIQMPSRKPMRSMSAGIASVTSTPASAPRSRMSFLNFSIQLGWKALVRLLS